MRAGAIILAAGASTRMGRNKMLLTMDGISLVRRSTLNAVRAGFDPVIVVAGYEPAAVQSELSLVPCTVVLNPEFRGPTSSSLHRGIDALPADVDATAVILADMVRVDEQMLKTLRERMDSSDAPLAASRYGEVFAPPLMFRRQLFPELLAWHGEGCGKQVVLRHRAEAVMLDWPAEALQDIDTPEDAARAGLG